MTPKERRAQMMKARGKTETTGINPNSPLARRQKDLASKTKTKSITPKERRARDIASRGESSTKYSPMRAQRLRSKGIGTSGDTDTEFKGSVKNLTKRGMARKMENAKPTATAKSITKTEKTIAKSPAKSKAGVGTKRLMAGISEFGKAFAKARKAGKKDFTFRDKQYAAITKQEVQKAGASGLGDYLNKLKRSETKIAKAPGQVTKKKGGMLKRAMGGSVNEEDLQRTVDRAKMIREARKSLKNKMRSPSYVESEEARRAYERNIRLKNMTGAAMSEAEMRRLQREGMKTGGSVKARGGRMGKQKPTKLY